LNRARLVLCVRGTAFGNKFKFDERLDATACRLLTPTAAHWAFKAGPFGRLFKASRRRLELARISLR
jgi:hypothetical protein